MKHFVLACLLVAGSAVAAPAERISGTNEYVLNEERWPSGNTVYWRQDNQGTFLVEQGRLQAGIVRCIGAGFGDIHGPNGTGICIFETNGGTFTWAWKTNGGNPNTWWVVSATGSYFGMTGTGTARTRVDSKFRAMIHRVTEWEGDITLPE